MQAISPVRPGVKVNQPGAIAVDIASVTGPADNRSAAVAQTHVIVEVQGPRSGNSPFHQRAREVHRDQLAAKLDHFRPVHGGLQPQTVMERGIPIIDRGVVAAERYFQVVVIVVADQRPLDVGVVSFGSSREA